MSVEPVTERVYHSNKGIAHQQRHDMSFLTATLILTAYLIGSISSAIISCRLIGADDPRTVGSKNPGATNVFRTAGRQAAILTLVGDLLKGAIPVWLASQFDSSPMTVSLVGLAALIGHCFPIFYQFRGGKGVATAFAALLIIHWQIGVGLLALWLAVFTLTRTSSLSAIIAALTIPLSSYYVYPEAIIPLSLIALLVLFRHYDNIHRLLTGSEGNFRK